MSKKIEDFIIYTVIVLCFLAIPMAVAVHWIADKVEKKNMFSCEQAEDAAREYLIKHHPDSDYEISSVDYAEKDVRYYVSISSPTSQDSGFVLGYNNIGKLTYNSYERMVTKKGNVAVRLSSEYKAAVNAAFEPAAPWADFLCFGELCWRTSSDSCAEPYDLVSDELVLDASYNLAEISARSGRIWLHVDVDSAEEVTVENLADILLYVRQTLDEEELPFYLLDVILDYHNGTSSKRLELEDFLYADIYEEEFSARLEKVVIQS